MTETSTTLTEAFNVETEEGSPDFKPVPAGKYVACIITAQVANLKTGKGQAVILTWEIEGGDYEGRKLFDRCIITHESADAMKFGRRRLKDICDACGIKHAVTDLDVLRNKSCRVFVRIEEDKAGQYAPKNVVGRVQALAQEPDGNVTPIRPDVKPANSGNGAKPEFGDKIPF